MMIIYSTFHLKLEEIISRASREREDNASWLSLDLFLQKIEFPNYVDRFPTTRSAFRSLMF